MESRPAPGAKVARRRVDGVVLLDKPLGMSSNGALQHVKRAYRALKAGHTGTLDPLATGLLPICLGEATKFSQTLLDAPKVYRTELTLGTTTETGDAEGQVLLTRPVIVGRSDIDRVLTSFRGEIMQVPHRYSAIKRAGRALYDYARAGEDVEVAARPVTISELTVDSWDPPVLALLVRCSKGTYIRSLAQDIGDALGCGAHVASLRRLATGAFDITGAIDLARLQALSEAGRDAALVPLTALVAHLQRISLPADEAMKFRQGIAVTARGRSDCPQDSASASLLAVYACAQSLVEPTEFIGVARMENREGRWLIVPARLLATARPD
ncbi:MAG: tRNA pseudouridine(55) synthase TruB [Betaproteobacteria bacterium]